MKISNTKRPLIKGAREPPLLISCFRGLEAANVEQNAPTSPQDVTACRANQAGNGGAGKPTQGRARLNRRLSPLLIHRGLNEEPHTHPHTHTHTHTLKPLTFSNLQIRILNALRVSECILCKHILSGKGPRSGCLLISGAWCANTGFPRIVCFFYTNERHKLVPADRAAAVYGD